MNLPLVGAGVTDEALMIRAQDDDGAAFAELYGRHVDYALRVAVAICRDNGRAEDAVQEGFFSIWRSRADYRPQAGSFQVWSMSIVRNRAIDSFRSVGNRPPVRLSASTELALEEDEALLPLNTVIAACDRGQMVDLLRHLPALQAQVVSLSFYNGLSHTEIAARLGIPTGTVKGRMRLGLEKLGLGWLSAERGIAHK